MNPEIENLINMALADGDVSEKERAIILRKAETLGEDKDEIEMILDGKIALMKKEQAKQIVQPSPVQQVPLPENKSNKEGDLKKCPSCGSPTQAFATKCSDCGHEFRNIQATQSVQKLFEMLNELETTREEDESNPLKAMGGMFSKVVSGQGAFGGGKVGQQKTELIKNFPVPNTKEDLLEFLSMAVPRAKKKGGFFSKFSDGAYEIIAHNNIAPVWHSKCEQIIMKAKFSMKEDKAILEQIEYYAKQLNIK